ncbi:ParB/RepB/Spo0J family partition protein [Nocardioides sp. CPCC 205120]|uniref:ParB/RepB/Spo0J family partition protein n=1 Tax=Nocardioides sp. CPCC 205120 TaxID=3406462 RepID=UPI003B50FD26
MPPIETRSRVERLQALKARTEHELASARRREDPLEVNRLRQLLDEVRHQLATVPDPNHVPAEERPVLSVAPPIPTDPPVPSTTPASSTPRPPAPSPARVAAAAATRPVLVDVPLTELHPDPDNPREDVGEVAELADSMDSVGLLQPIVARRDDEGRLVVVAGHRRLAAAQHLGWASVAVVIRRDLAPDQVLAAMLIENSHRRDLDPIEEARALSKISTDHGARTHAELAALVGRTQVHVSRRLSLLSLPIEEQDAIRAGAMNISDGVRRGRLASGRVRELGSTGHPHLGVEHDLASRARARCKRLQHRGRGRNSVGGVACGECWESVIRADEREHLEKTSNERGRCVLCDTAQEGRR